MTARKHYCEQHQTHFLTNDSGKTWWHAIAGTKEYCQEQQAVVEEPPDEPVLTPTPAKRNGHYCKKHMMRFSKMVGWSQYKHPIHGTDLWCYEQEDGNGTVEPAKAIEITSFPTANVIEVNDVCTTQAKKPVNWLLVGVLLSVLVVIIVVITAALSSG